MNKDMTDTLVFLTQRSSTFTAHGETFVREPGTLRFRRIGKRGAPVGPSLTRTDIEKWIRRCSAWEDKQAAAAV